MDAEIGIWGDSITYGECDAAGLGWVGRFRNSLFPLKGWITVYNRGVCGDTSEGLLKRFIAEADSIGPTKIVFAIGINDSSCRKDEESNKVPLGAFKKNIEDLVAQSRKYTSDISFVGLTRVSEPFGASSGTRFSNELIEDYDTVLKEVAQDESLRYIVVSDILNTEKDLADGLHPNAEGYEKLFQHLKGFLK